MRNICGVRDTDITEECLEFIDSQDERVSQKFFQLIEVIGVVKVLNTHFLKKIAGNTIL